MPRRSPRTFARCVGVAGLIALAGLVTACADAAPRPAVEQAAGRVSVADAEQPPRAVVDAVDLRNLRIGPARPEQGVPYPFDLYTHCGINVTRFGGRWWQAERPAKEPSPLAGPEGVVSYTGYTAGAMTLVAPERARFVVDERRYAVTGSAVVYFRPLPRNRQPQVCQ
ncbi:MAG TPA: hypothetical protein VNV66_16685 [Pilimelia sp.]|nr:hypothetical protein [Pilimelia sp.]